MPAGAEVELSTPRRCPSENPERAAARERGLPERPRAELLGELAALRRTIAVAGTHGKTTTASMLVHALRGPGWSPAGSSAAPVGGGLANAGWGEGEWLVVEADESDRSMLSLDVEIAVLTNVELDHHATFASLSRAARATSARFLAERAARRRVWDRPELLALRRRADAGRASRPTELRADRRAARAFDWRGEQVELAVPGAHNALNAAGALEAARLAGAERRRALAALAAFGGAGRRFELLGTSAGGALVYDDYAHHPTEVAATLAAARTLEHRRLVAVFQPHLYSRTARSRASSARALAAADVVVVLDVYPARERAEDFPGVSGLLIAEAAADAAAGRPVYWLPGFDDGRAPCSRRCCATATCAS